MTALRITAYLLLLFAIAALVFDRCQPKKPTVIEIRDHKKDMRIAQLLKQNDSLKTNIHDTLQTIFIQYRNRFDTVRMWLKTNPTWSEICRGIGVADTSLDCKSLVLYRYFAFERDSQQVAIYKRQWLRDSAQKAILTTVISLKDSQMLQCTQYAKKLQDKAGKKRKRARLAHIGAAIIGAILLIK